ncbi:MAG: DNA primase DnaG [Candidatus Heimdallarchaeota archaeon]|nr:DNA primase DnaG [Candidatus Heimdallarchaeota archaeon]
MGNKYSDETVKYKLIASISVEGIVEPSDIVGALFGQTEGLLDQELELKQLQRSGRIGRIDLDIENVSGSTKGKISIPSSLNQIETAIIAATLESVDRVGACICKIVLEEIKDVRVDKRSQIAKRAAEIMKQWDIDKQTDNLDISAVVEKDSKRGRIVNFGPDKLPAGPKIFDSSEIILVEGRADISNLMKMGITNTIAIEGTNVPQTIINLCKKRDTIALLDGDRGGDMILKELVLVADIKFVARAPFKREVEHLNIEQVQEALRNKVKLNKANFLTEKTSVKDFIKDNSKQSKSVKPKKEKIEKRSFLRRGTTKPSDNGKQGKGRDSKYPKKSENYTRESKPKIVVSDFIKGVVDNTKQTFNAVFVNSNNEILDTIPSSKVYDVLKTAEGVDTLIIDGVITQRIVNVAKERSVKLIAGAVLSDLTFDKDLPQIVTFNRI